MENTKQIFTKTGVLAKTLGVSRRTITRWAKTGVIPAIQPTPKMMLFDAEAVLAALGVKKVSEQKLLVFNG